MSRIRSTKSNVANLAKTLCTSSAMVMALASGAVGLSTNEAAAQWTCTTVGAPANTYFAPNAPATSTINEDMVQVNTLAGIECPNQNFTIVVNGSMTMSATQRYDSLTRPPSLFQQEGGNYTYVVDAGVILDARLGMGFNSRFVGNDPQPARVFRVESATINNNGTLLSSNNTIISDANTNNGASALLTINNSATGQIISDGFVAIIANSTVNTINNDGLIRGQPAAFEARRNDNFITNTGTFEGVYSGISARSPGAANPNLTINNSGNILATGVGGIGIKIGTANTGTPIIINNEVGGLIQGPAGGIYAATGVGSGVNLTNSGTINGDVLLSQDAPTNNIYNKFGNVPAPINPANNRPFDPIFDVAYANSNTDINNGEDTVTITTTSVINGIVDAGVGNNDTFILGGTGVATINAAEFDGTGNGFTAGEKYGNFENFFKRDSSQWIMTGTTTETGLWQVQGGELTVDAAMGGWDMNVTSATLSGTGTVGSTTIGAGGIIAPGNPSGNTGTLNVNGALTFQSASSTYAFNINPDGSSDVINVSGNVSLGGNGIATALPALNSVPSDYAAITRYDIIVSGGTVSGQFGNAADGSGLATPLVDYEYEYDTPGLVSLIRTIIRPPDPDPDPPGPPAFNLDCDYLRTFRPFTFNQCQAALGLTGFDFRLDLDVYNNLAELTANQLAEALDALTGEIHSESAKAGAEITKEFDELLMAISVNRRGNSTINEVLLGAPGTASTAYGADLDPQLAPVIDEDDYNKLWFGGLGSHVQIDEDGNAGGPLVNTYGIGGGVHMNHTWWGKGTLGVAAGYTHSTVNIQNRYQSSDIDTAHIGIYGSGGVDRLEEGFAARAAASYAYHWVDTVRDIEFGNFSFVDPIDRTAKANYTGQSVSADIEAKYNFLFETDNFGTAAISPYVRATIQRTKFSRFQEEGARFINLSGQAETYTPATVAVGAMLTGEYEFDKGWIWRPSAALAYEHYFHGGDVFTGLDYDGSTQPFLVAGAAESSHRIRFSTMSDLAINDRFSLTFATDNVFNGDRFDVSGKAGLKMTF